MTTDAEGGKMLTDEQIKNTLAQEVVRPFLSNAECRSLLLEIQSRRAQPAPEEVERLRKALIDATAHLAGAASAYRAHAKRHASQGKSTPDAMFSTRASDFDKAVDRARAVVHTFLGDKP